MKKILSAIIIILVLGFAEQVFSAGTVTQAFYHDVNSGNINIVFTCKGATDDGTVPDTPISDANMAKLRGAGLYLYAVSAKPIAGGITPDAADVFILSAATQDYLGSTDAGVTASKGANLIHATYEYTTLPYNGFMSSYWYPPADDTMTLRVKNQASASADWAIKLYFRK